ncbi:hypothetical protein Purlil1_13154 [Purpureocillium lilacinum]|uniref:Azaphilone pigments biosynthesis cluster protein L N-terminal domain-containing protein n=1 Tax=Purpureocillium lilacinum TaxID=33203 RepID=A0ABR0BEV8_PURLI|nr:hypothetical protein Purlil1_13154 [Purpureocillium lilacinum]
MDNVAGQPLDQLVAAAHQASSSLHGIVSRVACPRPPVSDLHWQLGALIDSLHQLCQQTRGSPAAGLSALRLPLSGCEGACNAIKEQARQQPALVDAHEGTANSWTKFKCFDCTTDDLVRLLAAYTATFKIAIVDVTLPSSLDAVSIDQYVKLYRDAGSDIEDQIRTLEARLEFQQAEQGLLEQQHESMKVCLDICAEFGDRITNRRPFHPAEEHAGMRRHRAALTALVANIDSALSAAMDLAIERASKGENTSKEAQLTRALHEAAAEARRCIGSADDVSHIDNHATSATGDSVQFLVSTTGPHIHGVNRSCGSKARQFAGHMNDETLQVLVREVDEVRAGDIGGSDDLSRRPSGVGSVENNRASEFLQRFKANAKPPRGSFARLCGARALGAISAPCRASTLLDTASQLRGAHTAWRSQATREWPSEYRPRRCCPCCSSMSLVLRCKPMGVAGRDATAMWQTQIPRRVHVADARPCDMHTPPHWEEAGWHLGRVSYTTTSDHAVAQSSIVYRGNVSRARPCPGLTRLCPFGLRPHSSSLTKQNFDVLHSIQLFPYPVTLARSTLSVFWVVLAPLTLRCGFEHFVLHPYGLRLVQPCRWLFVVQIFPAGVIIPIYFLEVRVAPPVARLQSHYEALFTENGLQGVRHRKPSPLQLTVSPLNGNGLAPRIPPRVLTVLTGTPTQVMFRSSLHLGIRHWSHQRRSHTEQQCNAETTVAPPLRAWNDVHVLDSFEHKIHHHAVQGLRLDTQSIHGPKLAEGKDGHPARLQKSPARPGKEIIGSRVRGKAGVNGPCPPGHGTIVSHRRLLDNHVSIVEMFAHSPVAG